MAPSMTMTRISSRWTWFYKYAFPAFWFGFIAVFVVVAVASGAVGKSWMFILMPCILAVVGGLMFRRLIWDLADEVDDGGDFLLVKWRGYAERIPLSNIMNVSATMMMNPPRIVLRLVRPAPFGAEVAFSPIRPFTLNPFAKSAIAEDLTTRAYDARIGPTT
jgi:hypothetical protein